MQHAPMIPGLESARRTTAPAPSPKQHRGYRDRSSRDPRVHFGADHERAAMLPDRIHLSRSPAVY